MKCITPKVMIGSLVLGIVLSSATRAEDCSVSFYCYGNSRLPATPSVPVVRTNLQPIPATNQQQAARQLAAQQAAQARQRQQEQAAARQRALQAQRIAVARQRAQQQARALAQRRAAQAQAQAQANRNNRSTPAPANMANRPAVLDVRRGVLTTVNPIPASTPIRPVANRAPIPTRRPAVENCSQLTSNLTQQAERVERLAVLQSKNGQRDRAKALFSQAENIRQRLKNLNCQVM